MRPTWAEIDLAAIRHNLIEIQNLIHPSTKIMAVVKANAYGHGVVEVAQTALQGGAEWLIVAIPEEGVYLRTQGFSVPILLLGLTLPEQAEEIVSYDLCPTIATIDTALALSHAAVKQHKNIGFFLKIDTGMHRIGVAAEDVISFIKHISQLPSITLKGIFTHFSTADARDKTYTRTQFAAFQNLLQSFEAQGINVPLLSAANSAAVIDLPEMHLDFIRPGIMLYGLFPSHEVDQTVSLRPAMQFKTRIVYIKKVPRGSKIGYGCTYTVPDDAMIATLPVGYADGYNRLLSNKGEVLIGGIRCPVVGRVCMDQTMVDVTNVPNASIGDEVVLFGRQGAAEISIDEIAEKLGTINYEIVCNVSARVPRVYINGNQD